MVNVFTRICISSRLILSASKCHTNKISTRFKREKKDLSKEHFSAQYCLNLVRQNDYENYLCTLLLDGDKRRSAFAIRAFNVEVAKVGTLISEETIGKMRLQFWNDSIDKCYENKKSYIADQPVLKEMKIILDNHKITKTYLKRLIKARDRPINLSFLTAKEMEDYAEQTVSSLYYLLLEIWGVKNVDVDHAASHLGKAQGITNLLRAIPAQGRRASVNIPQDILMKHGVSQERILRDKLDDKGVTECIFQVATIAHQHLQKARSLHSKIPKMVRPVFLPAISVDRYLNRLRIANFRLSDEKLLRRDQLLPMAYFWNKIRSKY